MAGSSRSSGFSYSGLRKGLRLIVNEPHQMTDSPADVAYLYKVSLSDCVCEVERGGEGGCSASRSPPSAS